MLRASLVVIEKHRLFREGLRLIFSGSSFDMVDQSDSIEDGLPIVASLQPALVLVGLSNSDEETTSIPRIRQAGPAAARLSGERVQRQSVGR